MDWSKLMTKLDNLVILRFTLEIQKVVIILPHTRIKENNIMMKYLRVSKNHIKIVKIPSLKKLIH